MKHENEDNYSLGFETTQQPDGSWEAKLGCRAIAWAAPTEEHAIGLMMRGIADLARSGAMNPSRPTYIGAGAVQHALEIVQEQLTELLGHRYDTYRLGNEESPCVDDVVLRDRTLKDPRWARLNDEISALGTAIAALARVKDF